ncbi:11681_t:CDS:1, partial [Scutellospora calospora]
MEFDESDFFLDENYIIESNISEIIDIDISDNSSKQNENITEDEEIFSNKDETNSNQINEDTLIEENSLIEENPFIEENSSIKENPFIEENINTELDKKKLKSIVHNHFTLDQQAK